MLGVECMIAFVKWRHETDSDGNKYNDRALNDEMLYIGMSANAIDSDIDEVRMCTAHILLFNN